MLTTHNNLQYIRMYAGKLVEIDAVGLSTHLQTLQRTLNESKTT